MNTIKKITLLQFRNYSSAFYDFEHSITCITGPNGSGKTNLLDTIYYLCYTKSYFSAYQQNSVQKGTEGFRLEGILRTDDKEEVITCKWKQGKKEVAANGVLYEKLTDHIGKYAAVMIAPDDMELINGASELRRKWVDSILGQTDKIYLEKLMHYQRVLQQRNAWLKMQAINSSPDRTELEYYDAQLVADGTYIYQRRSIFIARFLPLLDSFYEQLSGGKEAIKVTYKTDLLQKPIEDLLRYNLQQDMRMQRTLKGIHKDDWEFVLNDISLKNFGSQGQKKSFLFALKLAQYAYLNIELGHLPILLLDDIFEKLDQSRMEALLRIIRGPGFGQVVLTDTHTERVREALGDINEVGFIGLK